MHAELETRNSKPKTLNPKPQQARAWVDALAVPRPERRSLGHASLRQAIPKPPSINPYHLSFHPESAAV